MWGIKNLMKSLVPREDCALSKEDRLQMSFGMDKLLRRHGIVVTPEMVRSPSAFLWHVDLRFIAPCHLLLHFRVVCVVCALSPWFSLTKLFNAMFMYNFLHVYVSVVTLLVSRLMNELSSMHVYCMIVSYVRPGTRNSWLLVVSTLRKYLPLIVRNGVRWNLQQLWWFYLFLKKIYHLIQNW